MWEPLFGKFAEIPDGDNGQKGSYRIVASGIESREYCDVPLKYPYKEKKQKTLAHVLKVVVDTAEGSRVIKVPAHECVVEDNPGYIPSTNRLLKLREMDEKGMVAVLPCKPGDTIYFAGIDGASEWRVLAVIYYEGSTEITYCNKLCPSATGYIQDQEIGKTVFLTKDAAEAAAAALS